MVQVLHALVQTARSVKHKLLLRRARRRPSLRVHGLNVPVRYSWMTPPVLEQLATQTYEAAEVSVLELTLEPADRYLEIGGGIGVLATVACRIVGAENVTVFEANPELIPAIRATCEANGARPDVRCALVELDGTGTADFWVHEHFTSSRGEAFRGGRKVTVDRADWRQILEDVRPTYLNIDVEGGEVSLLSRPVPEFVRAMCLELHGRIVGHQAISELICSLIEQGFTLDLERSSAPALFFVRD